MLEIDTRISVPFLWGKTVFRKRHWSKVNLIVGPNGSGKTILAEKIAARFSAKGYGVRILHGGQINEDEESFISVLRENTRVQAKIESVLSDMFAKSIRFETSAGGIPVPVVVNTASGVEYNLREGECHGLKEILLLLSVLYGGNPRSEKKTCFVFDEPELHLHPQLQMFFMNEIRLVAERSPDTVFFLITHSPFFIDLRFPADLLGVVVCHSNRAPTSLEKLSAADSSLFQRFLPRFNTYHKQFFFSDSQIFVEGYTDQQIFSILLSTFEGKNGTAGTGVIDVGGKDELGVFFKVCALLGTDARVITDLDSLFRGKLCDVLCDDPRPAAWLAAGMDENRELYTRLFPDLRKNGQVTLRRLIGRLEAFLSDIGAAALAAGDACFASRPERQNGGRPQTVSPQEIFLSKLQFFVQSKDREQLEDLDTFKTVILQAVFTKGALDGIIKEETAAAVPVVKKLCRLIFAAAESARVYVLPKGCIEHYYIQNKTEYMPVPGKDRLFHEERAFMLSVKPANLRRSYAALTDILFRALSR